MSPPTLLAVSHGTSSAAGAAAIAGLVEAVARELPGTRVRSAFVDVQQPSAADAVADIEGPLVVVPLLLSPGFHVRVDLARAVRGRADARIAAPLGPDPRLADVLAQRIGAVDDDRDVILAAAGSRDAESAPACERMAALLTARLERPVHLAYLAARAPALADTAARLPGAVVVSYLLAHGYFHDLTCTQAPAHVVTAPLLEGADPPRALVELVADRFAHAAARLAR